METSRESEENLAFNAMIWGLALIGTGNNQYQNEFYDKQAEKLTKRYEHSIT